MMIIKIVAVIVLFIIIGIVHEVHRSNVKKILKYVSNNYYNIYHNYYKNKYSFMDLDRDVIWRLDKEKKEFLEINDKILKDMIKKYYLLRKIDIISGIICFILIVIILS